MFRKFLLICITVGLAACGTVRQQDLDAWVGQPVAALDTHSLFITLPVVKTVTDDGIEIRNYVNKRNVGACFGNTFGQASSSYNTTSANFNAFSNCTSRAEGCDNIFYIKNKKIIEYKPVGKCFTNETVQPEKRYQELKKSN